jgi:hypothetical protein
VTISISTYSICPGASGLMGSCSVEPTHAIRPVI